MQCPASQIFWDRVGQRAGGDSKISSLAGYKVARQLGMSQKIFLARHGERADLADPCWIETAEEPYDAPLTLVGLQQAADLGKRLQVSKCTNLPRVQTISQLLHCAKSAQAVSGSGQNLVEHCAG